MIFSILVILAGIIAAAVTLLAIGKRVGGSSAAKTLTSSS